MNRTSVQEYSTTFTSSFSFCSLSCLNSVPFSPQIQVNSIILILRTSSSLSQHKQPLQLSQPGTPVSARFAISPATSIRQLLDMYIPNMPNSNATHQRSLAKWQFVNTARILVLVSFPIVKLVLDFIVLFIPFSAISLVFSS
jgi:hypothetical protein